MCERLQERRENTASRFMSTLSQDKELYRAELLDRQLVIGTLFSHHFTVPAVQCDRDRCANWARGANHQPRSLSSGLLTLPCDFFASAFVSNCVRCGTGNVLNDASAGRHDGPWIRENLSLLVFILDADSMVMWCDMFVNQCSTVKEAAVI